ncbi:MAG: diacylglycerol kinase family lipid kinase [Cryomorphaceae bacterium]|nr:diacylglycerol kinase family lipid kinase [Cryomorphaceae bacterium]
MLKVHVILNGSKKITEQNQRILNALSFIENIDCRIEKTKYASEAIDLSIKAVLDGTDVIVAVGGDGTFHEVVNGIRSSGKDVSVAFLPNGTANDFVLGYGLTWTTETFLSAIMKRKTTEIDLIKVAIGDEQKWCLNIADTGFGGKVVQTLNKQRSWLGGKASYFLAILRAFFTYKKPLMRVSFEGGYYEGPVLLTAACNGPVFGDGLYISPEAKPNDGVMNITILGNVNLWDYLKNLKRMKRKLTIQHPEARYHRSSFLKIQAIGSKVYTEADGELVGSGEVEFSIEPAALRMLVP